MKPRLDAIDLLRGLVMVLMALDHVRDFFTRGDPTDLTTTSPALFFTRWVSHFCAPTFLLLAGVGAALSRQRGKSLPELSRFLLTRGLWMIFLEWCVVRTFGWAFNFDFTYLPCWVIWTLGWSMIVLAGLVRLPLALTTTYGLVLIVGHHFLDPIKGEHLGSWGWLWHFFHDPRELLLTPDFALLAKPKMEGDPRGIILAAGYPLVPWVGVMAVGYGLGFIYQWKPRDRRSLLTWLGVFSCLLFVLFRALNEYGDNHPWEVQPTPTYTLMAFLNCTKQPPSLQFLLMTLGPALIFLAAFDGGVGKWAAPLILFGRVPLFYYLLHLPLIHVLCIVAAWGQAGTFPMWLLINPPLGFMPRDFGFGLPVVYAVWLFVLALLYPLCRWYAGVKQRSRSVWLSYL